MIKNCLKNVEKIWNRINELIGINNAKDFVNTIHDNTEFIIVDVHKNTSFVEGNYSDEIVIVLHSVINNYLKTSLVQVKKHKYKYINQSYQ